MCPVSILYYRTLRGKHSVSSKYSILQNGNGKHSVSSKYSILQNDNREE